MPCSSGCAVVTVGVAAAMCEQTSATCWLRLPLSMHLRPHACMHACLCPRRPRARVGGWGPESRPCQARPYCPRSEGDSFAVDCGVIYCCDEGKCCIKHRLNLGTIVPGLLTTADPAVIRGHEWEGGKRAPTICRPVCLSVMVCSFKEVFAVCAVLFGLLDGLELHEVVGAVDLVVELLRRVGEG